MRARLRSCDDPDCRICRWNDETHQDSGHVVEDEPLAVAFLGIAAIVVLFFVVFFILPVLR